MTGRRSEIPSAWFEDLYRADPDPWRFATSDYEREKYAATLAALSRSRYGCGFEIGCSIGVLTRQLAPRVDELLAVDVASAALVAARERCADLASVTFAEMQVPDTVPAGRFDLILLSEVGYYWDRPRLDHFAAWLRRALAPSGDIVLVHWTGETDYPLTADEVHDRIITATAGTLALRRSHRAASYRLDVLGAD